MATGMYPFRYLDGNLRVGVLAVMAALAISDAFGVSPTATFDRQSGRVAMTNGRLELIVETQNGLNPRSLRDLKSGRVYADSDYVWPGNRFPKLDKEPAIANRADGSCSVVFKAALGTLLITQTFVFPSGEPDVVTESVELHNTSDTPCDTSAFACGFAKKIYDGPALLPDVMNARFCNVPYRRNTETGELCDYSVSDLVTKQSWFSTARSPIYNRRTSRIWGAEGWAWYQGKTTLLIAKYNSDEMEWSLLCPEGETPIKVLRFGGAGRWKLGDPEGAIRLRPKASFAFGATRYQILDGDWNSAYAAFRRFTESKGNRIPANFAPSIHWNELYDNPLWGGEKGGTPDTAADRQRYYRRSDMKVEADKAREIGCQCLYLDPGWDTEFGSSLWAADRLGTEKSFVGWLKDDYGMALALHTPLAPWNRAGTYPTKAKRMNQDGSWAYGKNGGDDQAENISDLCTASDEYIEAKTARLKELCRDGAYFLMFDGSWFPEPCWDPAHGHSVPETHQDHINAILKIAQSVHKSYPNVLIEQHDPMLGPGTPRYAPTYFMHDKPGAFDELWGYEYMVEPMDDIISHRAFSLYYVNLAYSIPIYLHIRLNRDNANAMMLWWYASTCRHLGMGGKPSDPAVWEAQKQAMRTYLPLKRFYTQGIFYGLDETIHAHTLPDLNECVINCFNLDAQPVKRLVQFHLSDIGLPSHKIEMEGGTFTVAGDDIAMEVRIPSRGHQLVKIRLAGSAER